MGSAAACYSGLLGLMLGGCRDDGAPPLPAPAPVEPPSAPDAAPPSVSLPVVSGGETAPDGARIWWRGEWSLQSGPGAPVVHVRAEELSGALEALEGPLTVFADAEDAYASLEPLLRAAADNPALQLGLAVQFSGEQWVLPFRSGAADPTAQWVSLRWGHLASTPGRRPQRERMRSC